MIPEIAWRLVPERLPPSVPAWAARFAEHAEFSLREERAYLWAVYYLNVAPDLQNILAEIQRLRAVQSNQLRVVDVSAGFIPLNGDNRVDDLRYGGLFPRRYRYAFGLLVGVQIGDRPRAAASTESELEDGPVLGVDVELDLSTELAIRALSRIRGSGIPFVVEARNVVEHAPPNPQGATAACYSRPRPSKRFWGPTWGDGILTARHVFTNVGFAPGTTVSMGNGTNCALVDVDAASTNIDAAILECPPFNAQTLRLATVAPGTRVNVATATNGPFVADVLRIFEDNAYFGNMFGHRVFLDKPGARGDSGSLVTRLTNGDAVGLYIGTTARVRGEGIVQSMRQVVTYFDIDLFL